MTVEHERAGLTMLEGMLSGLSRGAVRADDFDRFRLMHEALIQSRVRAEYAEPLARALRDVLSCFDKESLVITGERHEAWSAALARFDAALAGGVITKGEGVSK